ncbi:MAG: Hydroxyacylglutathione hydrolase [Candidatus Celerinatantimonas neptuna]|nr:MAG: Hydroxyacylglutathione hydrolase [Candidatus Celerinatantimonas neptuna]
MAHGLFPHQQIGDFTITGLSDGYLNTDINFLSNIEKQNALQIQSAAGVDDPASIHIGCYLIQGKGQTILIDSGAGGIKPWGGLLKDNLALMNITPLDIDTILLTHAHPDHIGGLLLPSEKPVFPNAKLMLHQNELAYWTSDQQMEQASERAQGNFAIARKVFSEYSNQLQAFNSTDILPEIKAIPLPGHTPGHTGYMIESEGQKLLIWGDIVHFPYIQIVHPDVAIAFDCDQSIARLTRANVLKMASSAHLLIGGMHLGTSGFAYISEEENKFKINYLC